MKIIHPKRTGVGRWMYPPLDEAMATLGLEKVETYVLHRHNTTAQYITTRTIMELCLAEERRTGVRV